MRRGGGEEKLGGLLEVATRKADLARRSRKAVRKDGRL